ncbi:MAG: hypothetical protein FJ363_01770 [Gemmatimonadetes bacterium]|nr:hypothetical protein [Gemmatimonadota bacterium]
MSEPATRVARDAARPAPVTGAVDVAAPSRDAAVAVEAKEVVSAERVVREREATTAVAAKAAPTPEALAASVMPTAQNALQAQRITNVGGVAGGTAAALRAEARQAPICYRVLPDSAPPAAAVVMRLVRVYGDTLHLEGTPAKSAETAWLVPRGATWRGIMITRGDTVRVVPATGILTLCPAP